MDMEQVEKQLEDDVHVKNSGYLNMSHYKRHRKDVIGGLIQFGDHFAMSLGYTLNEANLYDSIKIMRYWNGLCEQHAILQRMSLARLNASG